MPEELTDGVHVRVVTGLAAVPVVGDQQPLPGGPRHLLVHRQQLDPGQEHGLQQRGQSAINPETEVSFRNENSSDNDVFQIFSLIVL